MVQFEELLLRLEGSKSDIDDLSDALGLKSMISEIEQLELKATEPGFWDVLHSVVVVCMCLAAWLHIF